MCPVLHIIWEVGNRNEYYKLLKFTLHLDAEYIVKLRFLPYLAYNMHMQLDIAELSIT